MSIKRKLEIIIEFIIWNVMFSIIGVTSLLFINDEVITSVIKYVSIIFILIAFFDIILYYIIKILKGDKDEQN